MLYRFELIWIKNVKLTIEQSQSTMPPNRVDIPVKLYTILNTGDGMRQWHDLNGCLIFFKPRDQALILRTLNSI